MAALAFCPLSSNGRDRGCSSVGRAPQSHCGGQGFESPQLHHHRPNLRGRLKNPGNRGFRFPSAEVGWTNWKYARDLVTLLKVHLGELDGNSSCERVDRLPNRSQIALSKLRQQAWNRPSHFASARPRSLCSTSPRRIFRARRLSLGQRVILPPNHPAQEQCGHHCRRS
jgi:hypothetical protein